MFEEVHLMMEARRSASWLQGNHCCRQMCREHGLQLYILDVVPASDLPPGTLGEAEYMAVYGIKSARIAPAAV